MAEGTEMLSPSDVALLSNRSTGGGGAFIWIFGLLILLSMINGGGIGGNRGYTPQYATQADIQTSQMFGQMLDGNRDIANRIDSAKYDTIAVGKDIESVLLSQVGDIKTTMAQLMANQNECCMNSRLEMANNTQKILDAMATNRMADMQNQINYLQLQQATAGMMRFPNQWTYAGGYFPPITPTTGTTTG